MIVDLALHTEARAVVRVELPDHTPMDNILDAAFVEYSCGNFNELSVEVEDASSTAQAELIHFEMDEEVAE